MYLHNMAFKRRTTPRKMVKRYMRKTYRRRTYRRVSKPLTVGFAGFPMTKRIVLRYVQNVSINAAAGAPGYNSFRANGLHDPDSSGVGHQPMGYDNWYNIYNNYVVVGAKCTATFVGSDSDNKPVVCGILLDDDGASVAGENPTTLIERGKSKWKVISNNYTQGRPPSLTSYFSAKKFFNVKDVRDNVSRIGASFGADPSDQAYFIVWVGPQDDSSDLGAFNVLVRIEYIIDCSQPKDHTEN